MMKLMVRHFIAYISSTHSLYIETTYVTSVTKFSAYDLAEEDTNQRISQKAKESVETIKLQVIENTYYETADSDQQNFGINKGGLITNNTNLGETEVVSINENIYYETMDNENISK